MSYGRYAGFLICVGSQFIWKVLFCICSWESSLFSYFFSKFIFFQFLSHWCQLLRQRIKSLNKIDPHNLRKIFLVSIDELSKSHSHRMSIKVISPYCELSYIILKKIYIILISLKLYKIKVNEFVVIVTSPVYSTLLLFLFFFFSSLLFSLGLICRHIWSSLNLTILNHHNGKSLTTIWWFIRRWCVRPFFFWSWLRVYSGPNHAYSTTCYVTTIRPSLRQRCETSHKR